MKRADRRLGAVGRRFNDCRERAQIIRFCVRGAERAKTFKAAGQGRQRRWPTVAALLRRYLSSPT